MTARILLERLKNWEVYDEEGKVISLDLTDTQIEIPEESSTGSGKYTVSITLGYNKDRNTIMLVPSSHDGRLE